MATIIGTFLGAISGFSYGANTLKNYNISDDINRLFTCAITGAIAGGTVGISLDTYFITYHRRII